MKPGESNKQDTRHRQLLDKLVNLALSEVDGGEISGKTALQLYFEAFKLDQAERKLNGGTHDPESPQAEFQLNREWFEKVEVEW